MFKGLKQRLSEKKQERELYKETYKSELKKRKEKAIKLGAKKQAIAQAKKYERPIGSGGIAGSFEKFGKDFMANIDPNPSFNGSGFGMTPFPSDPLKNKK